MNSPLSRLIAVLACLLATGCKKPASELHERKPEAAAQIASEGPLTPLTVLEAAFANRTSHLEVLVEGTVVKFLPDDVSGDKHQKMIVRLSNHQTLLIAHNIDLARRIPESALDAEITIRGEYEWNDKGGVIHWTHRDPRGRHENGWIQFNGIRYE